MILYIDHQVPRPDEDAGSLRASAIFRILSALGHKVTVCADDGRPRPDHVERLAALDIAVIPMRELAERLGDESLRPDLAIIARVNVAVAVVPVLRAHVPDVPVIFDTVDLHHRRLARAAALGRDREASLRALAVKVQELAIARESDLVWVVSEEERQALLAEDPELSISVLSMIHEIPLRRAAYEERDGLGFVGGFLHAPNLDAVRFLVEEVSPRIRAVRPDVSLAIVGADMPAEIRALERPGVCAMGHVPDLERLLSRWRVFMAPIRYGAGVKGKITHALSVGLPAVTTSLGAEGMGLRHGEEILIADTAAAFAAAVLALYESPEQWERLSRAGQASVAERFSVAAATARIREDLARIVHSARTLRRARRRGQPS
jgi:glycosyltransferase involved in cell wall biosynthesis